MRAQNSIARDPTEIEIVTSHFAGDGSYQVKGNAVALFPDGSDAESMPFRTYQQHTIYPSVTAVGLLGLMKRGLGRRVRGPARACEVAPGSATRGARPDNEG